MSKKKFTKEECDEFVLRVGWIIVNLPMASHLLGHKTPAYTIIGNYLAHANGESRAKRIAKEFVNDLFSMSTEKMCNKWHGLVPAPKSTKVVPRRHTLVRGHLPS
jgi:hypothetical protein